MANYIDDFSLKTPTFPMKFTGRQVYDVAYSKESFFLNGNDFKYFEVQASINQSSQYGLYLRKLPMAYTGDNSGLSLNEFRFNCDYTTASNTEPAGMHPSAGLNIDGVYVGGRASEFPGFVTPGTPQRFGIAVNKNSVRMYFIVSSTNYSYYIHWTHPSEFPKGSRFKMLICNYGTGTGPTTGTLNGYSDPSTWMAGGLLGYTDPLFGEVDQLKQY